MASLYSSVLTSLLLACTCFTYGLSVLLSTDKFVACLYMLYIWPLCTPQRSGSNIEKAETTPDHSILDVNHFESKDYIFP